MEVEEFIARWRDGTGGAERANYQMFLTELCVVIGVPRPDVSDAGSRRNDYVFERPVKPRESAEVKTPKRIDLYKKGSFILEAKQSRLPDGNKVAPGQLSLLPDVETPRGARTSVRGWDVMMQNARKQAEGYVFLLDADHPAPPFVIVCDVGHCLEIYADFTGTGRAYTQFPDRNGYRIFLDDLHDAKVRERLATIWTDPHKLDPAKNAVRVTREIAKRLAAVSKALEDKDAKPEDVAHFLMRCLFTMFAEDTGLLPKESFTTLLRKSIDDPSHFGSRLKALWREMERGEEFSHVIEARVRHFNGGLFKDTTVFDLGREEIGELLQAAKADWREVDPAIFGTLLEQALDKDERRRLGAHYTPRAYVQRLVDVTIMEPLRADWQAALTKVEQAKEDGDDRGAREIVRAFLRQLCATRVLDPACGTGNFLYVSLELMKQLEGEVLETLTKLGDAQADLALEGLTVDPHLFLGLELNPRAAAIAELVVWIGYLQWHYRNTTGHPAEPILRAFSNINFGKREGYDAVLTWDGAPLPQVEMRDGVRVETYPNARRPVWPEAEFIVGNPPFIGNKRMRNRLGDEYVENLRATSEIVPESADFVMYWWDRSAEKLSQKDTVLRRFGLVTTNSITELYQRGVIAQHLEAKRPLSIVYAIPNHPWTRATSDAASVRIAMTVVAPGKSDGIIQRVVSEKKLDTDEPAVDLSKTYGRINADLSIGAKVSNTRPLSANKNIGFRGITFLGAGFLLNPPQAEEYLRRDNATQIIRRYISGRDITSRSRNTFIIDLWGLEQDEVRTKFPSIYQHLLGTVRPLRQTDRRQSYRDKWWLFAEPRSEFRDSVARCKRFIVTSQTAKHVMFKFVGSEYLPDQTLVAIATDDAFHFAVLSSHQHVTWAIRAGAWLGVGNDPRYSNSRTFDPFPFPSPDETLKAQLRAAGEELDATRKRVQAEHPDLTLTGLYNVLEKVKAQAPLTAAEEDVKTRGLVLILKDLHEEIDRLTAKAYGWKPDLTDEQILENLVALNAERAREEAAGHVRWLRPDYQMPRFAKDAKAKPGDLELGDAPAPAEKSLPVFPRERFEQPLAVEHLLARAGKPMTVPEIARSFRIGAKTAGKTIEPRVTQVLQTLTRYGRIVQLDGERYATRNSLTRGAL